MFYKAVQGKMLIVFGFPVRFLGVGRGRPDLGERTWKIRILLSYSLHY